MTMNLFTQFVPPYFLGITLLAIIISLPWSLILFPWPRWLPSRPNRISYEIIKSITKQIFSPINLFGQKWALLFTALMVFILGHNSLGLLPYSFTPTTQLSMNMGFAIPFWLTTVLIGFRTYPAKALSHFLPPGTPTLLVPFLIILETISMLIRPVALAVRLTANLTAGHLLLQLTSTAAFYLIFSPIYFPLAFIALLALTVLELAVAVIQAYVFVLLLSLYLEENAELPIS
uniref:ATP synthase subunit a n=1 Tax=Allobates femoralis TaxID=92733 RepID=A0A7L9CUL2_ALLFE|nr:ATP synthase F0 subunit 6 [Allobates femoralis]